MIGKINRNKFGNVISTAYIAPMREMVFSDKEVWLVGLLSNDETVAGIADKTKMNRRGLEGVVVRIKLKTGLKTIQGLVAYFIRAGLID